LFQAVGYLEYKNLCFYKAIFSIASKSFKTKTKSPTGFYGLSGSIAIFINSELHVLIPNSLAFVDVPIAMVTGAYRDIIWVAVSLNPQI
jgi:hypothetical protein